MLQRLLIITLTLCSLTASAQWQQTGSRVRYVNGLGIPTKDTAAGVAADSSQILIRPADSSLYIKYKRTWVKVGAGGGGTIGGSGTINRVPKFTAGTTLGNSSIVDSASAVAMTINPSGKVGINTLTPVSTLDVNGTFRIPGIGSNVNPTSAGTNPNYLRFFSTGADYYIGTEGASAGGFFTGSSAYDGVLYSTTALNYIIGGVSRMNIKTNGNTLINTTTDNGVDKLQVSGSMNVSARATAQNLSVTNNATISNKLAIRTTTQTANLTVLGGYSIGGSIPTDWNFMSAGRAGVVSGNKGFYWDIIGGSYAEFSTFDWGTSQPYNMVFQGNGGRILAGTTSDNNVDKLQVNGSISGIGFKQAYVTKTGTYTATTDDYVIDCTSGTFTVNLPALLGRTGMVLIIKNSGTGTITVDPNGAAVIDGAATYSLAVQYATIQIISDGTDWKIISKF
jgi:hypothetical protein